MIKIYYIQTLTSYSFLFLFKGGCAELDVVIVDTGAGFEVLLLVAAIAFDTVVDPTVLDRGNTRVVGAVTFFSI